MGVLGPRVGGPGPEVRGPWSKGGGVQGPEPGVGTDFVFQNLCGRSLCCLALGACGGGGGCIVMTTRSRAVSPDQQSRVLIPQLRSSSRLTERCLPLPLAAVDAPLARR